MSTQSDRGRPGERRGPVTQKPEPTLPPLAERSPTEILKVLIELAWLIRVSTVPLYYICDRGALRRKGRPDIYVDRPLPLREAISLLEDLLWMRGPGDRWRWRLCLCPVEEVTREGIHVLLMDPPRPERPWSEGRWMRSSEADERWRVPALPDAADDGGDDGPKKKTDRGSNDGGPSSGTRRRRLTSAQDGSTTEQPDGATHERGNDRRAVRSAASSRSAARPKSHTLAQMELCFGATVGVEIA